MRKFHTDRRENSVRLGTTEMALGFGREQKKASCPVAVVLLTVLKCRVIVCLLVC
jgi:hypothetical protein